MVKKEKLGERITALQQLVSPFGKVCFEITVCVTFPFSFTNFQVKMMNQNI